VIPAQAAAEAQPFAGSPAGEAYSLTRRSSAPGWDRSASSGFCF